MEFVVGATLRQRLNQGPLPIVEAVAVARCLLEALAHAHAAGLLHRDIKPENVVLVEPTFAKLLDFGIALPLEVRPADDLPLVGTIGYLAPEQATRGPLDARTDVFQVGVVLYEMVTGRAAFGGRTPPERLAAAVAGLPNLAALDGVEISGAMRNIIKRALARDPGARYETAAAFLRELREADGHATATMPTIGAVADFANRTGNGQLNWLENALAEGVHTDLGGLDDTSVIPRPRPSGVVRAICCRGPRDRRPAPGMRVAGGRRCLATGRRRSPYRGATGGSGDPACAGDIWNDPPRVHEALAHLLCAVERDDSRGMWWLALGTVHRCLGRHREALYSFTRAQRLERVPSRFNTGWRRGVHRRNAAARAPAGRGARGRL